ncbi:MAG: FeoA family protein [Nocardioidaceae bacterium]
MAAQQLCLGDLQAGARGRVTGHASRSRPYLRRLLAMGLIPGAEFTVVRRAPLGDPVEIELLGFLLSLRAAEAADVRIEIAS